MKSLLAIQIVRVSKLDVQVAADDARDRATWMKGSLENFPHLPLPPAQLFSNANALKGYAGKQLSWLLDPLKLKRGVGDFAGWNYQVDKAGLVYSGAEVAKLPSPTISLSMLIDWADMRQMASLSSGNAKALKEGTGVTKWVPFCKVLCEMIFLMVEEDPADWYRADNLTKQVASTKKAAPSKKVLPSKKAVKLEKNPFVETDSEDDFVPFTQKTPPRPTKAKAVKALKKKPNVLSKLKKPEGVRGGGGADFDLQLGLALSISAEEVREFKKHKKTRYRKSLFIVHCF